eukprot:s2184_g3.t1
MGVEGGGADGEEVEGGGGVEDSGGAASDVSPRRDGGLDPRCEGHGEEAGAEDPPGRVGGERCGVDGLRSCVGRIGWGSTEWEGMAPVGMDERGQSSNCVEEQEYQLEAGPGLRA